MGIPVPISVHNAPLPPDDLTDVRFNYEWRRLIVELLWPMTQDSFWSGAQADIEAAANKATVMIEDIYTAETVGGSMVYQGALVGTTSVVTALVTPVLISFTNEATPPNHDKGGFFDPGQPTRLTVPSGAAGFYLVHAFSQWNSGVINLVKTIKRNGTFTVGGTYTSFSGLITLAVAQPMFLADGDTLTLWVNVSTGSRNTLVTVVNPNTVQFGLHKIGDAP